MTISLSAAQAEALHCALTALRSGYAAELCDRDSREDKPTLRSVIRAHDELLAQLSAPTEHGVTLEGDCTLVADAVWLHLLLSLEALNAEVGGLPLAAIDAPDALRRLAHIKELIALAPSIAQQAQHDHQAAQKQAAMAA